MAKANMCMFVTKELTILLLEEAIFSPPEQEMFSQETKSDKKVEIRDRICFIS